MLRILKGCTRKFSRSRAQLWVQGGPQMAMNLWTNEQRLEKETDWSKRTTWSYVFSGSSRCIEDNEGFPLLLTLKEKLTCVGENSSRRMTSILQTCHRITESQNTALEGTSTIPWSKLSWQKHLDKMAQHPIQQNLKSVQSWWIHHFPREVIPMAVFIMKIFPLVSSWNLPRINLYPLPLMYYLTWLLVKRSHTLNTGT